MPIYLKKSAYFYKRWEPQFKPWFWLNIIVNFLTPLLVLMSRDSKRGVKDIKGSLYHFNMRPLA